MTLEQLEKGNDLNKKMNDQKRIVNKNEKVEKTISQKDESSTISIGSSNLGWFELKVSDRVKEFLAMELRLQRGEFADMRNEFDRL